MLTLLPALLFATLSNAFSPTFLQCQTQRVGCPEGTIIVSQVVDDPDASFTSIQEAIASLEEGTNATILISSGTYHETVNVTRTAPLTLLGELPPSVLNGTTHFNGSWANTVSVYDTKYVQTGMDDADSVVLTVAPSRAHALIGAGPKGAPLQEGFGNVDFKAYNIDFHNRAANYAISQALVTDISYSNASFYGCSFASFQDTWYTGRNGSTYVYDSVIYGQTDYLFGFGTAWFENIVLANRACGGGIVAWKGTNQTDAPGNRYGAYISNSLNVRSPDANSTTTLSCYLGRSWNELATTVFLSTYMEDIIKPEGWTHFSSTPDIPITVYYAEFNSTGPGGDTSQRVPVEHILTEDEAAAFTVDSVFLEHPAWIDSTYVSTFES